MVLENYNWIFLTLASAFFGAIALILKKKGLEQEHSLEYLGCFKIFEFIILLPLLFFVPLNFPLHTYLWMYFLSFFITIGLLMSNKGFKRIDFTKAIPLFNFQTVIVLFASMIFLKEFLNIKELAGVSLLIFALYKVDAKKGFRKTMKEIIKSKGTVFFLIAMTILGTAAVFEKKLLLQTHYVSFLGIMYFFSLINTLIFLTIFYDGYRGIIHGIKKEGKLIFSAAIVSTASNLFMLAALTSAYVVLVSVVKRSSNLFTMLIGGKYFHEKDYGKRFLWTVVAVIAVIIITV
jgi:drug/metabolite transporter (DMT)-like permease